MSDKPRLLVGVFCALVLSLSPALAQVPGKPITTMEMFWKYCDERNESSVSYAWCTGYITGQMDGAITIARAQGKANMYCLNADSFPAIIEQVLSYMPSKVRDKSEAGVFVQAAIARAMDCRGPNYQ
jgi:hypothetical protein